MKVWKIERGPEPTPSGSYVVFAMVTDDGSEEHYTQDFYFEHFENAYNFCRESEKKMEPIQLNFDFGDDSN